MNTLNFYPGPSKLEPNIIGYISNAVNSGLLERNHRSQEFALLYQETKELFHSQLSVPKDYELLFLSSATECWEVISQSLVAKKSEHVFNGAFGRKWFDYASNLSNTTSKHFYSHNDHFPVEVISYDSDLLALTHNETSNGTYLNEKVLSNLRNMYKDKLIAYDATSSMGGLKFDWEMADIWFASVQKCFGIPSGLGVMVISPRAIERARALGKA
ncbi:MAG: aminotransferase class V-fold PLP-dependent enzyme, partial [Nitrososphaeraceae archaeon]|nr:aminotransferase class V-fold PLP-dependent enzyme [Nitrososphaeraceae archaeon]